MARKTLHTTGIAEDFALTAKTIAYIEEKFPTIDIDKTLELFSEHCQANGTMYADWQAGFRTWVRRNVEEKWKGVVYKLGRVQDPAWVPVLAEAKKYGFRDPVSVETPQAYRTALERWKDRPVERKPNAPVIDFSGALKGMK